MDRMSNEDLAKLSRALSAYRRGRILRLTAWVFVAWMALTVMVLASLNMMPIGR